jgi:hypothetical protein
LPTFFAAGKKPTPFKFPVPRQTVDGVTRRILQTRFYPHGRPGVRRQAAPTAAHLGLERPVQTSGNFLCEINGIKSGHDNENFYIDGLAGTCGMCPVVRFGLL